MWPHLAPWSYFAPVAGLVPSVMDLSVLLPAVAVLLHISVSFFCGGASFDINCQSVTEAARK